MSNSKKNKKASATTIQYPSSESYNEKINPEWVKKTLNEPKVKTEVEQDITQAKLANGRRTETIIGVSVVMVILAILSGIIFFACMNGSKQDKSDYPAPSFVTSDGGIVFTSKGIDRNGKRWDKINSASSNTINHKPVTAFYSEALCAGCSSVERETSPTIQKWLKDNKIVFKHYPITILDVLSHGTYYSTRMAAAFYRIAEISDAKTYFKFLSIMMSEKVQPKEEDFKDIPNANIAKYAQQAGLSADKAKQVVDGKYQRYAYYTTRKIVHDKKLWRITSDGSRTFMTPVIVNDGKLMDNFGVASLNEYIKQQLKIK